MRDKHVLPPMSSHFMETKKKKTKRERDAKTHHVISNLPEQHFRSVFYMESFRLVLNGGLGKIRGTFWV